ncbi:recombinase RecT [Acinetobacter brisouii]|uniref:recombinase RecT n=1 Tax=Acinetobacter brisouii TaxID=396323 RepID=UPI00124C3D4F|nr:recombinase RecT [Acinetobacter brisouii]
MTQQNSTSVGLLNVEAFELSQRIAKMLANSTLVPEQYRATVRVKGEIQHDGSIRYKDSNGNWLYHYEENPNAIANCVIALNMASRMNTDPLLVMQNLYLIEGRPAWTSQFITGTINSSGRFSALRFDLEDLGEKTVSYTEYVWENNKKTPVEKHITIQDMSCVAWAIERETNERVESTKITLEMAIKEGWFQKNGSKWQTMPQQMLSYRAASFFGRLYAPELLMGLRSAEEEQERSIIDVTPDEYQEQATSATNASAATLKRDILQSKSLDHLNTLENKITALENANERDELFKLFNAQKTKLSSQQESSEQNTAPVRKPRTRKANAQEAQTVVEEIPAEEVSPVDTSTTDDEFTPRKTSDEMRKLYSAELHKAESLGGIKDFTGLFENDGRLTEPHKAYLREVAQQCKDKLTQPPVQQQQTIDPNKSKSARDGIEQMIQNATDIYTLETQVANTINGYKSKLTPEDHQAILNLYAQRKTLFSQQSMFEADQSEQLPFVDSVILKIRQAQTVDELVVIITDPDVTKADDQRINQAYDQRLSELKG